MYSLNKLLSSPYCVLAYSSEYEYTPVNQAKRSSVCFPFLLGSYIGQVIMAFKEYLLNSQRVLGCWHFVY